MVALMFLMLLLNFPIMVVLLFVALLMLVISALDLNLVMFIEQMSSSVESYLLHAISMFSCGADIMIVGRTANRLLYFVNDLFGHVRGRTGSVTAATSTLFGSVSGSSKTTIVAIGCPMRNRALQYGYEDSHIM